MVKVQYDAVWSSTGWSADAIVRHGPAADARPLRARGYAIPGLTSLHSHAFQRGMAGLAEIRGVGPESFWTWRDVMYRFLDRLTPDYVRAIAAMAYVEMVERGFTSVVEFHYLHHDVDGRPFANLAAMAEALVEAAHEAGIGFTLLPTLYRFGGFGGAAPGHGQRRFITTPEAFEALVAASARAISHLDSATLGVALHSLRAVSPDDVIRAAKLLPGAPIHIHAAEQEKEVADCLAWSGKRPVQWLLDHAGLDARWCIIHATHMNAAETRGLAQSGSVAGLCPITEANLGDGIFPATAYLESGGRFGIGTDSNVLISAAEELRTLEYGQRLRDRQRVRLALPGQSVGESLLRETLAGGAQAAGRNSATDWLILDADHEALAAGSQSTVIDRALFACPSLPIKDVWSAGTRLVVDGRHVRGEAVRARFKATMAEVSALL